MQKILGILPQDLEEQDIQNSIEEEHDDHDNFESSDFENKSIMDMFIVTKESPVFIV